MDTQYQCNKVNFYNKPKKTVSALLKLYLQIGKLISFLNSAPVLVIRYFLLENVWIRLENFPWRRFSQILSNPSGNDMHKFKIFRLLLKNHALNRNEKILSLWLVLKNFLSL